MGPDRLRARGINVADPASEAQLSKLKAVVSNDVFDALYDNIYRWFDGFSNDDFDEGSFLRVWSIERVITSNILTSEFVLFIDFSLHSAVYGMITGRSTRILSYESMRPSSIKIDQLVDFIACGKLDDTLGL